MLRALFARDFQAYFDAAGAGSPLWLFVHVPKTAGSSMIAEISAILKPAYNIDIDHTDTTRTYQAKFDAAVAGFVTAHGATPYRFCTGHINARQAEVIRAGIPDLRCFTMLRNPLARIVSDYRYQRSAMNTARANFIASTPDFETYIARKHVHNKITLHLAPRAMVEAGDIEGCVDYITNAYAFVGLQEMYPLSLRVLTTLMGQTRTPEAKVRVNDSTQDQVALSPEMQARLRALNAVDIGVFQVFLQRYRDVREDLIAFMRGLPRAAAA